MYFGKGALTDEEKAGLKVCGRSADGQLVEMIELPKHAWFLACQFHPEFTSTPRDGHPLFISYVTAALNRAEEKDQSDHPIDSYKGSVIH